MCRLVLSARVTFHKHGKLASRRCVRNACTRVHLESVQVLSSYGAQTWQRALMSKVQRMHRERSYEQSAKSFATMNGAEGK